MLASRSLKVLAVACLFVTGCLSCEDECDFDTSRCAGNVVESCGDGPDRLVPRRVGRQPCEGLTPFCVTSDFGASCAASEELCDESTYTSSCDGTVRTYCSGLFVKAVDCASYGPDCVVHDTEAKCGIDPATPCDFQAYRRHCEGDVLRACTDGIESAANCPVRCFEDPEAELAYCTDDER